MPYNQNIFRLCLNENLTIAETYRYSHYDIGLYNSRYKLAKKDNEDSAAILTKNGEILLLISDGAGGHPKGAQASNIAIQSAYRSFYSNDDHYFSKYIEKINEEVKNLKVGARATFLAVYINDNQFWVSSVGDSEVVFWNSAGNKVYSNIPQSYVGHLIHSGEIDQEDSLTNPERHYVSNLVGDSALRIESTTSLEMKKGNTLLMGSDGLFDNITHNELGEITTSGTFESSFEKLCFLCDQRSEDPKWHKDDDTTFIFLKKALA